MERLSNSVIWGEKEEDQCLVKKLFGDIEIRTNWGFVRFNIKRVCNWYADSQGKAPLYLLVPLNGNILSIWPPTDFSPYEIIRFGTPSRIPVPGLFLSRKEDHIGIFILTRPEAIDLEDGDSFGL